MDTERNILKNKGLNVCLRKLAALLFLEVTYTPIHKEFTEMLKRLKNLSA